jgi:ceramide glucosyltransferase
MIHSLSGMLQLIALLGCISSSAYYLICIWTARIFVRQRSRYKQAAAVNPLPPVSILKPLKGIDPEIYEAFRSHCVQDYPEYEIIFGISDAADPAVARVGQLMQEFPQVAIRLVICPDILGTNVKVSNLEQMVQAARYEHLIVNDSDIRVERDYLQEVVAPFRDEKVGMVTCLYRGSPAPTLGSRLEALGISTDFSPGVLVAQQLEGGLHFGLGSTLAFRRSELAQIGGFKAMADFLADDYELGRRIAGLGFKVVLAPTIVETHLPPYDFRGFLAHQIRWARGVRDARLGGYIGLVTTFGLMWSLLLLIAAHAAPWSWAVLGAVSLLRVGVALAVGTSVLQDAKLIGQLWLLPVRDLIAAGIWIASFFGHAVIWRGEKFRLKNGRLIRFSK